MTMKAEELEQREGHSKEEVFIISRTDEGYRVYSPEQPTKSYTVTGSPGEPACTCPDFQYHEGGAEWRCKHILAVLKQFGKAQTRRTEEDDYDRREREAIQRESEQPPSDGNGASQMLLKRSVSPDGHIDSLSVEFSSPVGSAPLKEIKGRALMIIELQGEIVKGFLSNGTHNGNGQRTPKRNEPDGSVLARMTDIGGMNGKYGRRLFINLEVDSQRSKIFGTQRQLEEAIEDAGFTGFRGRVAEGFALNLPCRVITKPSDDGRYINIEKVLPIEALKVKEGVKQ